MTKSKDKRQSSPQPARTFPIRKRTNATERKGVAFVRNVVENANCVFREIDRASDYGHDAFVHLIDGERVTAMEIALQIKAGQSFCGAKSCKFFATRPQLTLWDQHPFTTLGVVYDPDADCAWWVDLRAEARARNRESSGSTVAFSKCDWNRFDDFGFSRILLPTLLGEAPRLELQTALSWAKSDEFSTHELGTRVLLARFRKEPETWAAILEEFSRRRELSSFSVYLGLIRVMGHTDEGYFGDEVPQLVRDPVKAAIKSFGKSEVTALLHFVDDNGFERGTAGYGLFAIIPRLPDGVGLLRQIAADSNNSEDIRANAALMAAIHDQDEHWWSLWIR